MNKKDKHKKPTVVTAIICPRCKNKIFSRARHDFRYCSCGDTFIDGGFDYTKIGGVNIDKIKVVKINLNLSMEDLYQDWNNRNDKYGIIK